MIALIESPEGDNRRRHFDKISKKVVDIEPLIDAIPLNDGIAPVNYGFIIGTFCQADKEEIDVLVLSKNKLTIGQEVRVYPIALLMRKDGDNKVVAKDDSMDAELKEWVDIPAEKRNLIKNFFSFHHPIFDVKTAEEATDYILDNKNE